ncbi:alpha-galactosidase [Kineococcus indalonis]|uniref:alpha-galactosidase n=1 Tax=Kineococcus indalonis TaxID=2696566 RepID=UPI0014130CC3|nr:alpha-galactosidase [Kineococcus indalonis]NAZ84931.1 alpha-galactosidase [Kineococcus indalonis]
MSGTWVLPTRSGEHVVAPAPHGAGLVRVHWGARGGAQPAPAPRRTSFETPLDLLPLEATALGTRSAHAAELVVRRADGLRGARLRPAGEVTLTVERDAHELRAPFTDEVAQVDVELVLRSSTTHDVVTKHAVVRNRSPHAVELLRCWGGAFTPPVGPGARIGTLTGAWSREFTEAVVDLPVGTFGLGSRQGLTSHGASPVVTVRARDDRESRATGTYAVALAWSGSWRLQVETVPFTDHVRVSGGPDDESGVVTLPPGGSVTTPGLAGLWVPGGADEAAQAWHAYQRTLARSTGSEHRPVVANSWYATGFDVRVEHQLALADAAADLGAEVFVVDDGWFRGRTCDRAGLGDWEVDAAKFPGGLEPLIAGVRERGLCFGLWVEPEAVNEDSDLYRAHPDWVHRAPGRDPVRLRHQLLLDVGRPEVEAWVLATLRRLLTRYGISYLKWDLNRAVTDGGAAVPGGDDWSWRHTQAYHRVLDALRAEFPHVTVEACAGGGGRIDLAVLARTDVVWPSDETGPRDRLAVQHGFLSAYPAWVMSSWVTDELDVLDREPVSVDFRCVVAMAGVMGLGGDLLRWSPEQRARVRELVALHRSVRHVLHGGLVRRHGTPADPEYAVQYTGEATVVVLAWARPGRPATWRVPLGDLPAGTRLRARGGDPGSSPVFAAEDGLVVTWSCGDCDVLVLDRV